MNYIVLKSLSFKLIDNKLNPFDFPFLHFGHFPSDFLQLPFHFVIMVLLLQFFLHVLHLIIQLFHFFFICFTLFIFPIYFYAEFFHFVKKNLVFLSSLFEFLVLHFQSLVLARNKISQLHHLSFRNFGFCFTKTILKLVD